MNRMDLPELVKQIEKSSDGISERKGIVAKVDGEWRRVIYNESFRRAYPILRKMQKGFEGLGLIPTVFMGEVDNKIVMGHKTIKHITMHHEWTRGQKLDAMLMTLRLQKALWKHNLYLSDPHIHNVTFDQCRPVYFDYDSIQHSMSNRLDGQNWMRMFWYGRRPRVSWNMDMDIPPGVLNDLVFGDKPLQESIEYIKGRAGLDDEHHTKWIKYKHKVPEGMKLKDPDTYQGKYKAMWQMFMKAFSKGIGIGSVMDIGSSYGNVVKMFTHQGCKDIVALELDSGVAQSLYVYGKKTGLPVTIVNQNIMTLYENCGRNESSFERLACDLTVSQAVVHHTSYFRNVPLENFAKTISMLSKRYAIVDWIPDNDKTLKGPKKGYDRKTFIEAFRKYFKDRWYSVESVPSTREMFLFCK